MSNIYFAKYLLGPSIPIICYHQVRPNSGMTPEKFGKQLDWIAKIGFQTITLAEMYQSIVQKKRVDEPSIVITFDDCTVDNWIYAIPELKQRKMKASFFAITDFIKEGKARTYENIIKKNNNDISFDVIMKNVFTGNFEGFMNTEEIFLASDKYKMEIYSHTASHQACFTTNHTRSTTKNKNHWSYDTLRGKYEKKNSLTYSIGSAYAFSGFGHGWDNNILKINTPEQRHKFCVDEFLKSRIFLENLLHKSCPFLCLPWGQYDNVTLAAAKAAGYSAVLTLEKQNHINDKGPLKIHRLGRLAIKDKKKTFEIMIKLFFKTHSIQY